MPESERCHQGVRFFDVDRLFLLPFIEGSAAVCYDAKLLAVIWGRSTRGEFFLGGCLLEQDICHCEFAGVRCHVEVVPRVGVDEVFWVTEFVFEGIECYMALVAEDEGCVCFGEAGLVKLNIMLYVRRYDCGADRLLTLSVRGWVCVRVRY